MPHAFDTGETKAQRTRVREAVIARIADLRRTAASPRYLTAIKALPQPYRGEGDVDGLDMLLAAFNGQAPAVGIALGRKTYDEGGLEATAARGEIEVCVYCVSQHQRDLVDGRLAADVNATANLTLDPGIETILEHVEERLAGQELGLSDVGVLRPSREDIVGVFADITIAELRFTLEVDRTINPARGVAQLVTSIEAEHFEESLPDDTVDPLVTTVTNLSPEP
jgi:hypothetical protein